MTTTADDLTIVLTLKDRAAFTLRWMSYANGARFPFKVLIADGGTDESVPKMFSERSRFPNVDYEYVRYPYDATYSDYYAKVSDALHRVRTAYVALADNDDLLFVDGLARAVEFLAAHPDYSACGGQCVPFWISSANADPPGPIYGHNVEWKYSNNATTESAPSARERVYNQSLGVNDLFYDVFRTSELRRQFDRLVEFDPKDLFLMEELISYLSAIAGKIKQLDCVYVARQQNSPGSSGSAHQERYGGWWGRMLLPTWSEDFTRFVEITAGELAAADGIALEEAKDWVVKCYRLSVAPSLLSDVIEEKTITPAMPLAMQVVRSLVRLPESSWLRRSTRWWYRKARWLSFETVYGTEILATPATDARSQLEPVLEFLHRGQPSNPTSGT